MLNTMKIQNKSVLSARVLKIEFAEKLNSYVLHFAVAVSGGYEIKTTWTNSSVAPEFTIGQSVVLLPIKGKDDKVRYSPLPA